MTRIWRERGVAGFERLTQPSDEYAARVWERYGLSAPRLWKRYNQWRLDF